MAIEVSGRIGPGQLLRFGWFSAPVPATPTPQPTVVHGKATVFKLSINGSMTNVSTYCKTLELNQQASPIKTSSITNSSHTYIPGPSETSIPFTGFFEPTIAQNLDAIAKSQPTQFEYYPAGTATGNYCFSGTAILQKNDTSSPNSEANNFSGELTMSGPPRFTTV